MTQTVKAKLLKSSMAPMLWLPLRVMKVCRIFSSRGALLLFNHSTDVVRRHPVAPRCFMICYDETSFRGKWKAKRERGSREHPAVELKFCLSALQHAFFILGLGVSQRSGSRPACRRAGVVRKDPDFASSAWPADQRHMHMLVQVHKRGRDETPQSALPRFGSWRSAHSSITFQSG